MNSKVEPWTRKVSRNCVCSISISLRNYLLRTISTYLSHDHLEKGIHQALVPALTGRAPPLKCEHNLLALPIATRLGSSRRRSEDTMRHASIIICACLRTIDRYRILNDNHTHVNRQIKNYKRKKLLSHDFNHPMRSVLTNN